MRTRLTAAFVAIVALPLIVAASIVAGSVPHISNDQTRASVADASALVQARLQATCQRVVTAAVEVAQSAASPQAAVRSATADQVDAAVLLNDSGTPIAVATTGGVVLGGSAAVTAANGPLAPYVSAPDCRVNDAGGPLVVAARVTLNAPPSAGRKPVRGTAITGIALAATGSAKGLLGTLAAGMDARVSLVGAGRPAASGISEDLQRLATAGDAPTGVVSAAGRLGAVVPLLGGAALIVSARPPSHTALYVVLGVAGVVALLLAFVAGQLLARRATEPLSAMSAAARRIAGGDLDLELPEQPGTEFGDLAVAFNDMTATLRETITDLRASHDELRRSVGRLGSTLSGTHDLDQILQIILDTGMSSAGAQAGALLLTSASRETLFLAASNGLEGRVDGETEDWRIAARWDPPQDPSAPLPPGVLARVAATGEIVHGIVGPRGLHLLPEEPHAASVLAIPLRSSGRITGVLALYDRTGGRPFAERDIEMVQEFVSKATVAIDNVLMHREAQRLSVTDGLTGLWNYRYASLALEREVERAQRFGHTLALIMLDLDRFKRVNDVFGHQRGDAVLIEVARRVRGVIREVDILARYGGEEMLLILPETDLAGAKLLADRILAAIRSRPVGGPGEEPVQMTTSLGIAVFPTHGTSARTLLHAADSALYAAKSGGRDTARVARVEDGPAGELRNASDLLR